MIDFDSVSPLRQPAKPTVAPVPRHPDQTTMFESPIDTTFAVGDQGAALSILIRVRRTVRQKCAHCGARRICYFVGLGDVIGTPAMCSRCFGIR